VCVCVCVCVSVCVCVCACVCVPESKCYTSVWLANVCARGVYGWVRKWSKESKPDYGVVILIWFTNLRPPLMVQDVGLDALQPAGKGREKVKAACNWDYCALLCSHGGAPLKPKNDHAQLAFVTTNFGCQLSLPSRKDVCRVIACSAVLAIS